jgi:hypothetical protein
MIVLNPHSSRGMADLKPPSQPLPHRIIRRSDDNVGETAADYIINDEIATGGCGVVWRARQICLSRDVAIKRIVDRRGSDPASVAAFISEAIITGALAHPSILPIYDVAVDQNGIPFYAMPLLSGETWLDVLPFNTEEENLLILDRICEALAFAHSRGVIHCDLKPDNILLGPGGTVLVADWGLSLLLDRLDSYPLGMSFGTLEYLAPEQAVGNTTRLSVRTDIYQLGGMLHQIITGGPPHLPNGRLPPLDIARRNIIANAHHQGELADIAMRALATDPHDRHGSVVEFQKSLLTYRERVMSRILCETGNATLTHALESRADEDFLQAIAHFQAAGIRWNGNVAARNGLATARFSYAEMATLRGDFDLAHRMAASAHHPRASTLIARIDALRASRTRRERHVRYAKIIASIGIGIGSTGLGFGLYLSTSSHAAFVEATRERIQAEARLAEDEMLSSQGSHHWRPIFAETFQDKTASDLISVMPGTWKVGNGQFRQEGSAMGGFSFPIPLTDARLQLDIIGTGHLEIKWPITVAAQDLDPMELNITDDAVHLALPGVLESTAVRRSAVPGAAAHLVVERVGQHCIIYLNGHRKIDTHLSSLESSSSKPSVICTIIAHAHGIIDNLRIDTLESTTNNQDF